MRRLHADQADIDADLVRRLVAAQFPQWAGLPVEPVDSAGTVNAIYRLGEDLAVRLPLRPAVTGDAEREQRQLASLAPFLPVAIPVALGIGRPADGYPGEWSVHRWLDGANPLPETLTDPRSLALDLAGFVGAFRRIDLPDGPPAYRGGPLELLDAATRSAIDELRGMIDTGAATEAWEAALAAPPWSGPPAWVHADLMPGNLLVSGGRLSAVIDFGAAGVGDPACDLIVAWNLLPADARDDFRVALRVDDASWARGRGRALSMSLIQLPYYKDTNPAMAANSRHVIAEVLASNV